MILMILMIPFVANISGAQIAPFVYASGYLAFEN